MKKPTPTEKTLARLRARRERLAGELATIDRMLAAAEGKAHPPLATFTTPPYLPSPGAVPVVLPALRLAPTLVPHYPAPDFGPRWDVQPVQPYQPPAFPWGEIICLTEQHNVCAGGGITPQPAWAGTYTLGGQAPIVAAGSH